MSIVKITSSDELPFGLLSNHYSYEFELDGKTWKSISHYVYYKLFPHAYKEYAISLSNIKNQKLLYAEFMKRSKIIYNLEYVKLLEQALREKYKSNPICAKYLLNTGDAKLYYHNEYNKMLGVSKNNPGTDDELTNVLGKLLEKIRQEIRENYNENFLYTPYMALTVLETVFKSTDNVSDYINMIQDNENVTFDTIIDKYGKDKIKSKMPYDIVSELNGKTELSKILKLSIKKPAILIYYVLKTSLRKYTENMQLKINDIIFDNYINDLLSKTNSPKNYINELYYVKTNKMKEIIAQMFYDNLLDDDLTSEIKKEIDDIDITTEEDIEHFEKYDILKEHSDLLKEEKLPSSSEIYLFDDSDVYLSINSVAKKDIYDTRPMEFEFKLTEYNYNEQTDTVEINTSLKTYTSIFEYIELAINNTLYLSPYIKYNNYYKIKKRELMLKALKVKFGVVEKVIDYPRNIIDFRHVLKNLCNNREILFIDDDQEIGCQYLKNYKNGDNELGEYLMKMCNEIEISDNIYDSFNYSMVEFIENDIFMKRWMTVQVEYIMCIIVNIISYMMTINNENVEVNTVIVRKILSNIIKYNSDDVHDKLKVPNFFYDIIRKKSNNFSNFKNTDIIAIVSLIWESIIENIALLKTNNQHIIKLTIYKMQLILSSNKNCSDENDVCIGMGIIYLIESINKIVDITNLEKNEINCISSILLKKYNEIKVIKTDKINEDDLNDIFGNYIVEEENDDVDEENEIIDENEDRDEDRDEENDEDRDYEDGGGYFKKYDVKADGDSFYISIYNALKKTSNGKYLETFVKCVKDKFKVNINTKREDTIFVDDLRKLISDKIEVDEFYNYIKTIKDDEGDEKIKNISKSFGKEIGETVINHFIDEYEKDSEEKKQKFIEKIKNLLKISRISPIKELDVKFCIELLESCGIKVEIEKDIKDFTKNDDTIYLFEYLYKTNSDKYRDELQYKYVLWKDVEEIKKGTEIDRTFDRYKIDRDKTDRDTTDRDKTTIDRDTTDKDDETSQPFYPENIIKKYYDDEIEEEYDDDEQIPVNKRQVSVVSLYLKKNNLNFDPKIISKLIQTFKISRIPQQIKHARINFFVFKNKRILSSTSSPVKINESKLKWLFNNKNSKGKMVNLNNLKLTDESIYSVTPWREADQMSKKIIKYISKPVADIIITDATANVGGNSISFYNHGVKTVNSVEIDPVTCNFLKNNLKVYNYDTENVICDNYLKIKDELIQDCVFIDPPWGGKSYANKKILDLYLGKTEVTDIIFDLFVDNKTKLIVLKAPLNYNYHSIELILKKIFISGRNVCDVEREIIKRNGKPSYYIYYIYTKMFKNENRGYGEYINENPGYEGAEEYDPENPGYGDAEEYDPYNPGYGDDEPKKPSSPLAWGDMEEKTIVKTDYCYIKNHDKYNGYYGKILNTFDDSILVNVLPKTKTKINIGMTKILNGNYDFVSKNDYENSL
jgi:predicted NAD-dependent protein-ADP-ribosyltransferase YbiA (DUF1768 family)/predicted RNA methylase